MICQTPLKYTLSCLHRAVRAFGLLLTLAALPVFGQQIHQLSYNGSTWADQNLSGAAAQQWAISAFFTTPNDQFHVFYGAVESNDLHQLFYNGSSWADEDLNQSTALCEYCGISGFSVDNFQYVFYTASDYALHQMLYNNVGWVDTNLSVASGATALPAGNTLVAFTTSPALHVYFTGDDSHIHQTYATDGTNWQDQDLTLATGGPLACQGCLGITGFNVGNFQYVYYLDANASHIHQLSYNNVSWTDEDLTALTKSPPAYFGSMSAFLIPGSKTMRVYFVSGKNHHIMQLSSTSNGKWSSSDVTRKANAPVPDGYAPLVAIPNATGGDVNVYYVTGHAINRLYQPTSKTWANQDLSAFTNGANPYSQLAGFSLNNNQYLYYVVE